jgi:DNA polymerase delta subunit 3
MVRIVDMDEVSEGERNSDDGEDVDPDGMGNDEGTDDGLGGVVDVKEEKGLEGEKVKRWGVVLVQKDELDGTSLFRRSRLEADATHREGRAI